MVTAGGTHRALISLLPWVLPGLSCDNCEADSITLKFGRAKETHVGLQLSLSELGLPMAGTVPTCHYSVNGRHRVWLGTRRPCSSHDTRCLLNVFHPESFSRSSKIVRVFEFHGIQQRQFTLSWGLSLLHSPEFWFPIYVLLQDQAGSLSS